jgi:hypothetical protein
MQAQIKPGRIFGIENGLHDRGLIIIHSLKTRTQMSSASINILKSVRIKLE